MSFTRSLVLMAVTLGAFVLWPAAITDTRQAPARRLGSRESAAIRQYVR